MHNIHNIWRKSEIPTELGYVNLCLLDMLTINQTKEKNTFQNCEKDSQLGYKKTAIKIESSTATQDKSNGTTFTLRKQGTTKRVEFESKKSLNK